VSIALDGAAPIERFGKLWTPWSKRQLIDMTASVPLSKAEQIMLGYGDMIRFIGSIRGLDLALGLAGGITEQQAEQIGQLNERMKLATDLVSRVLGEFADEESEEEPSLPLAVTVPTGD